MPTTQPGGSLAKTKGKQQLRIEQLERDLADERMAHMTTQDKADGFLGLIRAVGERLQIVNTDMGHHDN